MLLKKLAITAAASAALAVALPASADLPYWAPAHGYRARHAHDDHYRHDHWRHDHRHGHHDKVVVIKERSYGYTPPVVVLNPGPVYAPYPAPAPAPSQPGWDVNVGFRFGGMF